MEGGGPLLSGSGSQSVNRGGGGGNVVYLLKNN